MDAVFGRAEIHGARAERIAGAAHGHARQIRLTRDHLGRRIPIRPLGLARDFLNAGPGETFAADADAVTHGLAVAEHEIEISVGCIDHDGARRFARRVADNLTLQARIELGVFADIGLIGRGVLRRDLLALRRLIVEECKERLGLRGAERGRGDQRTKEYGLLEHDILQRHSRLHSSRQAPRRFIGSCSHRTHMFVRRRNHLAGDVWQGPVKSCGCASPLRRRERCRSRRNRA